MNLERVVDVQNVKVNVLNLKHVRIQDHGGITKSYYATDY